MRRHRTGASGSHEAIQPECCSLSARPKSPPRPPRPRNPALRPRSTSRDRCPVAKQSPGARVCEHANVDFARAKAERSRRDWSIRQWPSSTAVRPGRLPRHWRRPSTSSSTAATILAGMGLGLAAAALPRKARAEDADPDGRPLSGQAEHGLQARPLADPGSDQRQLQQLLRIRHLQGDRGQRPAAQDAALGDRHRRPRRQADDDRHRRPDPESSRWRRGSIATAASRPGR